MFITLHISIIGKLSCIIVDIIYQSNKALILLLKRSLSFLTLIVETNSLQIKLKQKKKHQKPLESDMKVYVSIIIYKKNGGIQMRLRRKACVLRAFDSSTIRSNSLVGDVTSPIKSAKRFQSFK